MLANSIIPLLHNSNIASSVQRTASFLHDQCVVYNISSYNREHDPTVEPPKKNNGHTLLHVMSKASVGS